MTSTSLFYHAVGNGQPLVLLHGWGVNSSIFLPLLEHLHQYSCLAIDLPGFGDSNAVEGDFEEWVDAIAAHIPSQSLVLGWSLGGLLATRIAQRYPDLVSGLITVASSPCFLAEPEQQWPGIAAPVLQQFEQQLLQDLPKTVERFLALQAMGSETARDDIKRIRELVLARPQPQASALEQGLAMLGSVDLRDSLKQVNSPWLRIWGKLDGLVPRRVVPLLNTEMNQGVDATDVIINKASHAPFISHTDEFLRHFQQWSMQKGFI
ncbi:pimeloyl-ACP methyl ester esterase BioH [Shewanella avicenniae]|uniref:Pimeloyl-[acyl-carrier protein] methyl ester esterase n=1 Tax=Shewanella avicenniae TaxID=2814294 RepID=A0ABX7QQI6_9GAMM|nr:pimeloyl-ACP methyl ester esterase BioH [Shewanella avicenniae]QSX33732.1 pimeloyl-ACP methyl ester esterase BioH [Shewanella avicenniae]